MGAQLLLGLTILLWSLLANAPVCAADSDTAPPVLRILEPTSGKELDGDTLTVEIEYRDTGSGVASRTLHVLFDGKDYAGQFDQHNRGATAQIRLPKSLPIGENTLTVEIADRAGNVARAETQILYAGPPDAQYNAGFLHAQQGRWNKAAASFEKAVKFNPQDADAYVQLGHAYQRLERYQDAVAAYRQATMLKPDDTDALVCLGDVSMRTKDFAGAVSAYRKATEIDTTSAATFKSLGLAYRAEGKYPEARQAFEKASRLDPGDADAYTHLGVIDLAQKNYMLAELSFRRAVLVNPKSTPAYIGLGQACLDRGRYDKAVNAFNQALEVNPKSTKARFGLGVAYLKLQDRTKAQEQVALLADLDKELSQELARRLAE